MIKVVAKLIVQEDKIDEFKKKTENLIAKTRQEDGNISYELHQDINNNQIFSFLEEWQREEHLKKHICK
ncbi:putative quinol monooxygenase [Halarsenatibacter silvermanii]|uniref:Antibiotic biosynthesis monooxygenase n=1 Tax=Halarsenatibacter silvermanii TaxID=321763 RepID=A0A1G9KTJ1_9FIRM|nr:putative quinol monooxygenase [Halarsenatibacter silvermanii]SDL52605.1 Antibiotic biosynthesis monooxygenase [Halarsenatibacter silvermanii]